MNNLYDTIYELETSLLKPEVRSSVEQLDNLLADDFKEFGSSGRIYTKENILERLPSNTDDVIYRVSDFDMKVLSDSLVMTNFKTDKVINGTERVSSLRTSLWVRENDEWKIFFHQGTVIG